jgi:hypothetical protein
MVMVSDAAFVAVGAEVDPPTWHAHSESAMAITPVAAITVFLILFSMSFSSHLMSDCLTTRPKLSPVCYELIRSKNVANYKFVTQQNETVIQHTSQFF